MSALFSYPKSIHARSQKPYPYKNYGDFKGALRVEFGARCVYCQDYDKKRPDLFTIDHYRPRHLPSFAGLVNDYGNLYYCCAKCNPKKGGYWPKTPNDARTRFIPVPCEHVMTSHVKYVGVKVDAQSDAGAFTVLLLDLNNPARLAFRESVVTIYETLNLRRAELESLLKSLRRQLANALANATQKAELSAAISKHETDLERIESAIDQHCTPAQLTS